MAFVFSRSIISTEKTYRIPVPDRVRVPDDPPETISGAVLKVPLDCVVLGFPMQAPSTLVEEGPLVQGGGTW